MKANSSKIQLGHKMATARFKLSGEARRSQHWEEFGLIVGLVSHQQVSASITKPAI